MEWLWGILAAAVIILVVGTAFVWRPVRAAYREARFAEACRAFHRQRERLEAKFVQLGIVRPRRNAPRWTDCEFDDDVAYARSRSTGELSAFVAVAIETEDLDTCSSATADAVGSRRAATAVFRFDGNHWETDGRAIFNVTPTEAIHLYKRELEMVGQEVAGRS